MTSHSRRRSPACWPVLLLLCFVVPASAVEVGTLYTAEVPLDPNASQPREDAYRMALYDVLLKVSGATLANDPVRMETLFPEPALFVVQFQPGQDDTLIVTFDGAAIETVLRNAGQTVWGSERPLTLVWLAIDWGGGEREILAAADTAEDQIDTLLNAERTELLRERLAAIAERRGLPIVLPLLDSEDLERVTYADIRGGFDEVILAASERYQANSILIGVVDAEAVEPNRWRYYFGPDRRDWRGEPEQIVPLVADMLAAEFAIQGDAPLRTVALTVAGVDTVDAYADLQARLREIRVIERLAIERVDGDRISYSVDVRGGGERLGRALRFAGLLEDERIDYGTGFSTDPYAAVPSLNFYYEPR